ncbi:hypothetical protein AVEN_110287-1 [Araneus ventricosus]|uniref:Uncharacterized protein n=1 Tax=Araneus ventricosus TaxID=182803 RepID=A0A4Y2DSC4_ARAVE|nr:hypothetical protein AVEN_110287-1 [Araneus ventricosus]
MVRNYKPEKDIKFLEVKINEAVSKIENGSFSVRAAAVSVVVNFTLSLNEIKESITVVKHLGVVSYIPAGHENELAACLKSVARWGIERN